MKEKTFLLNSDEDFGSTFEFVLVMSRLMNMAVIGSIQ